MRGIKFRAWDRVEKQFRAFYVGEFATATHCEPFQQYTGLHDKNGKEIWEGDILQSVESFAKWDTGELERAVVEWHDNLARFGLDFYTVYGGEGYTGKLQNIDEYAKAWVVIGNIYEETKKSNWGGVK